jgi:hypothetical protein
MITTIAAIPAIRPRRKTLAGELNALRIPKATPVFCTYVMLKRPSITGAGWPRSKWDTMEDLEILSDNKTRTTRRI